MTLLDRFAPLAQAPEALAKISLKLIDPRLVEPAAWSGVKDLLAHVRKLRLPHDRHVGRGTLAAVGGLDAPRRTIGTAPPRSRLPAPPSRLIASCPSIAPPSAA